MITVKEANGTYVAVCDFSDKDIVKAAGFRWDPGMRQWWTTNKANADKLAGNGVEDLKARIAEANETKRMEIEASRQADADVVIPAPAGLEYLPYQKAGIAYASRRDRVLIADEMGLGKTIQAIGVINADESIRRVLVICPASLRLNWKRELEKWLVDEFTIAVAEGKNCPASADILIINYDICDRHAAVLRSGNWDLVIVDEAHYLKSPDAKRTVAILGREANRKKEQEAVEPIPCRRLVLLTGTPIPNRPVEAWPLVRALGVEKSFFAYAQRYCAAIQRRFGWDFSGSSNLGELQDKLRAKAMVRRMKADVLKELPAKRRAVIELPAMGAKAEVKAEAEAWESAEAKMEALRTAVELAKASDDPDVYRDAVARLKEAATAAFTELSHLRKETALAKVPFVVEHLANCLEQGEKVVCFAHHKDVIAKIIERFDSKIVVSITGDTPMVARQAAVDRFQKDASCQLFIGNIQAAGVGLTLTASAHVVFAELDWVPGNVTQCEDRCHRIGQTDSVLVEHLVLEGSVDARMARTLIEKQAIISAALDDEAAEVVPATPVRDASATESASRRAIIAAAKVITPEEVAQIHADLITLAMRCDGARKLDGAGFNAIDSAVGKSLAACIALTPRQAALGAKIVGRYRKQLGK